MTTATPRIYRAASLSDLKTVAEHVLTDLPVHDTHATVLALHGELGAGKTAFVQQLASLLGVREHVTSPTFIIMRSYETEGATFSTLVHMDAYRIESEDELPPLRLPDIFEAPRTLVCIEWAERLGNHVPKGTAHLSITREEDARTCMYTTA